MNTKEKMSRKDALVRLGFVGLVWAMVAAVLWFPFGSKSEAANSNTRPVNSFTNEARRSLIIICRAICRICAPPAANSLPHWITCGRRPTRRI